ncbi:hypothetical protein ACFOET_14135 [Parapedobacter deserti]|uniref:Uncharacterized protein n=1 Tax=Parapedobacter deserti TaxID=1912957 RepID=A0ABV7JNU1_9SPHI
MTATLPLTPEALKVMNLFLERFLEWLDWKTTQVMAAPSLVPYRELLAFLRMARVRYNEPDLRCDVPLAA